MFQYTDIVSLEWFSHAGAVFPSFLPLVAPIAADRIAEILKALFLFLWVQSAMSNALVSEHFRAHPYPCAEGS